MLRSIKGEGPIRLVPSIRLSEEDSVREAELANMCRRILYINSRKYSRRSA